MIKENGRVMYIGPTIHGVVKNGAVFSGGIPKTLERLTREKPIMKNLIVPLSGIVQAARKAPLPAPSPAPFPRHRRSWEGMWSGWRRSWSRKPIPLTIPS